MNEAEVKELALLTDAEIKHEIEYVLSHNELPLATLIEPLCISIAQSQFNNLLNLRGDCKECGGSGKSFPGYDNVSNRDCPACTDHPGKGEKVLAILSKHQCPPRIAHSNIDMRSYEFGQQDMIDDNFRRIKK